MINYNKLTVLYMDDENAIKHLYKKDILENLKDNEIEINDKNIMQEASYIINDLYNDMLTLINTYDYKINYDYIEVVYSLGLWYGRRQGKTRFKTLKEAIQSGSYDYNIIYFDNERETLKKQSQHHDGSNTYKYYKVIKGKKYAIKSSELLNIAI